jgi:hypothetical protein
MFDNLSRHTLIRIKNGGIFLIKCKIYEWHSMKQVPCYIGHLYKDDTRVDYEPWTCYIGDIECVLEDA